jgi:hypothetical protein
MKKSFFFILCLSLGLTLISCSSNEKTESNAPAVTDNSSNSKEQEVQKSADATSTDNDKSKEATSNLITFTTYTADEQTLATKTLSTIQVEENLSLQDKLTKLANELSTKGFNGLPIKVVRVETINGQKKATINLEDLSNNSTIGWSKTYFQGTTMGSITTKQLVNTFRQKSYSGEWISSVEFLYNNNPIESEHVPDLENSIKLR